MQLDKYALFDQGIYVEKMTPPQALAGLVDRLAPLATGIALARYGAAHDGGYLVPEDLRDLAACFSPGVGDSAQFERDLLDRAGIPSHLADHSVDGPPDGFEPRSFTRRFLGAVDDETSITLDSWVRASADFATGRDLMLQMDIEGDEYVTLLAASEEVLRRFRILVVEIHDVESWGDPAFFRIVQSFFDRLLAQFWVVHNHPNNCCGLVNLGGFAAPRVFELTFLRKDRARPQGYCGPFPHPLDAPNLPGRDDLVLPARWQGPRPTEPGAALPIDGFLAGISGLIHVGANTGQERALYASHGLSVVWVEPIPAVFRQLEQNLQGYPRQRAVQYLLCDQDGRSCQLHIASNGGESSSMLELAEHREIWPEIHYTGSITLTGTSLATMVRQEGIDLGAHQALVLDTQGTELQVLRGAGELLGRFDYIQVEVADFEAYAGCCRPEEVAAHLARFGFLEIGRARLAERAGLGAYFDLLYRRLR